jgi:hypothetical protein
MCRNPNQGFVAMAIVIISCAVFGRESKLAASTFRLDSLSGLEIVNIKAEVVEYHGRRAVHLIRRTDQAMVSTPDMEDSLALVNGTDFKDGTIEAEVVGMPAVGAPADARGFVGIASRVAARGAKYECFYLRPTNGRSADQLRRNHSVQYVSAPGFPWFKLRKENPGVYESYADMEAGEWTKIKIEVAGTRARLYVNGAAQPCLIVNDLKQGDSRGQIALWTTLETDGYFSNLTVQ